MKLWRLNALEGVHLIKAFSLPSRRPIASSSSSSASTSSSADAAAAEVGVSAFEFRSDGDNLQLASLCSDATLRLSFVEPNLIKACQTPPQTEVSASFMMIGGKH